MLQLSRAAAWDYCSGAAGTNLAQVQVLVVASPSAPSRSQADSHWASPVGRDWSRGSHTVTHSAGRAGFSPHPRPFRAGGPGGSGETTVWGCAGLGEGQCGVCSRFSDLSMPSVLVSAMQRVLPPHPRVLGCSQWRPVHQWSLVVPERVSQVGVTCDAILVTSPLVSDFSLHVLEWKLSLSHTRLVSFPELQGENRGRERR